MRMLNQSAEYALRVVVQLADLPPEGSSRASELAKVLRVPANYLSKILHQLAVAGILTSRRGRSGGFRLARAPDQLPLAEVIAAFDDVGSERSCLLGQSVCSDRRPCKAHHVWQPLAASISDFLAQTTVADLQVREVVAAGNPARARRRTRKVSAADK
jgi:Rrf2 family protein